MYVTSPCSGSRHAYSNLGYLALGEVIEAVTRQSYESYVASLLPLVGVTHMYVGGEDRVHWQSQEVGTPRPLAVPRGG